MSLKKDFPLLMHHPELIYLDSAATLQKPIRVIDGVTNYLQHEYANVHRGWYRISQRSEELFWEARKKTGELINAIHDTEIIFTANSTDASNKLVQSLLASGQLVKGDVVLLSEVEHHANIVPWQMAAERYGLVLRFVGLDDLSMLDMDDFSTKYDEAVKLVALTMVANSTGNIFDLAQVKETLRDDTLFVVDASQGVPHMYVDVQAIGCDFLRFTGHKLGAHTGIGVLWGKQSHLRKMIPTWGGGGAISDVTQEGYALQGSPDKFEPGTPNLVGVMSLLYAMNYIESLGNEPGFKSGYARLEEIERPLLRYCLDQFEDLAGQGVELIGTTDIEKRVGVFSFTLSGVEHPLQLGQWMAEQNICIRCGGQCAQPFHLARSLPGSCRISLRGYTELRDVETFFEKLREYLAI